VCRLRGGKNTSTVPDLDNANVGMLFLTPVHRHRGFYMPKIIKWVFAYCNSPKENTMNKIECSVAIQVLPQVEDSRVIEIVDKVIAFIESLGLTMMVGPFETTVEGDFDTLMDMVKECQRICILAGAPHVLSYVKIHYSPKNGIWSIGEKTAKHNE